MNPDTPKRLLKTLAIELGSGPLELNDDDLVGLTFDGHEVYLIWLDSEEAFLFCGLLDSVPAMHTPAEQLAFHRALLERNHLMTGASHAAIGLRPESDLLTLSAYWPTPASTETTDLGESLLRFVDDLRALNDWLAEYGREPAVEPRRDPDPLQFV